MSRVRRHVESTLNRSGFTLLGGRSGDSRLVHRIRRIGTFPHEFAHLQRDLAAPFEVCLERITTSAGFSYDPAGWHPYVATLKEHLQQPDLPYERSTLYRYYARFQPRSCQEVLLPFAGRVVEPLSRWPARKEFFMHVWSLTPHRLRRLLSQSSRNEARPRRQELGPQTSSFGHEQIQRILAALDSIQRTGFRPDEFRDGRVTGYFLVRGDEYRFVVTHGNHRLPALQHLGITRVPAKIHRVHPPVVNADELDRWSESRDAILPPAVAEAVLDHFLTHTGREHAERLGLVDPSRRFLDQ